jgi:hypothetical protein
MKYIVPEYYKTFQCKCGDCRQSCCSGWPVSISKLEYYHLLGINCSKKLRIRLDCALKICPESNEGFAQISADWNGNCSLQREDGLCSLQTELGGNILPAVCRLYPRHARHQNGGGESSCSNSCEAVVDTLMQLHKPLQFEAIELSIEPIFKTGLASHSYDYRTESIEILQDRSLPLLQRFMSLSNFLFGSEFYTENTNPLSVAFRSIPKLLSHFEDSISISNYCMTSQYYFNINRQQYLSAENPDAIMKSYLEVSVTIEVLLPNWQVLLEQLIVNHMFYNNFSLTDNQETIHDDFISLITMYSFLTFNLLGNLSLVTTPEKLVDYLAAMFRVIEHSGFRSTAIKLYKNSKYTIRSNMPILHGVLVL